LQFFKRFKLWHGKPAVAGVHIGMKHIRVVKVERNGEGFSVVSTGIHPTPAGVFPDDIHSAALAEALTLAVRAADAGTAALATVIPGEKAIVRHIRLPVMPEKEVGAAVRWEAERHIPVPVGELVIRHAALGDVSGGGVKQLHVLLVAAPRKTVQEYYALFQRAGLRLAAIDLQAIALWRVFTGRGKTDGGTVAIVNIGSVSSQFITMRDDHLQLTRMLMVGGDVSIDAKGEDKKVNRADGAIAMQKDGGGISGNARTAGVNTGDDVGKVTAGLERRRAKEIAGAIRDSLNWYHAETRGNPVERIIICGSWANLTGLSGLITAALGLPVDAGFRNLGVRNGGPVKKLDPSFATALGLALREV
jgi:type IV pilus assembly protein PilM